MYKIIGADGAEYGPASEDQIRRWIAEGRANAQTKIQKMGTSEWVELGNLPEFADALAATLGTSFRAVPPPTIQAPEPPLDRDYQLSIEACIAKGWELFQKHFGVLFLTSLIYLLIVGAVSVLTAIPFIGPVFSLASWIIMGPLVGGLLWVFIRVRRGQHADPQDVFTGFGKSFLHLMLGQIVPSLLASLCLLPAVLVGVLTLLPALLKEQPPGMAMLIITICTALVCAIPMVWLNVNWTFTIPLVIDKGLLFWPAMRTSWRMVQKHWWRVFAVLLIVGVMNMIGLCVCCVGLLFSLPLSLSIFIEAYETIFGSVGGGDQTLPREVPGAQTPPFEAQV